MKVNKYWTILKNCRRFFNEQDANDVCETMNMLDPNWIVQDIVCG